MRKELREFLGLPIKDPMNYWIKYWKYYIQRLKDEKEINVGLTGPRLILESLKAEVQFHNSSKHNKDHFKRQLYYWKKCDAAFSKLFSGDLVDLLEIHYGDDGKIQMNCSKIIDEMNSGSYFIELLNCLYDVVDNAKTLSYGNKCKINQYSELLISEFVANNFSLSGIEYLPEHHPSIIQAEGGNVLIAPDECMNLRRLDFDSEEKYYSAIEDIINNRSLTERKNEIEHFFLNERDDYTVLVPVKGVKGDVSITIGDINIYSPSVRKYIIDENYSFFETDDNPERRILAAVPVKNCVPDTAIEIASSRLQRLFNILTSSIDPFLPFSYNKDEVVVLKNGMPELSTVIPSIKNHFNEDWRKNRDYLVSVKPTEITSKLEVINKMFSNDNENDETYQILSAARYWYNKGREAEDDENRLLFSWVAIEGIFSVEKETMTMVTKKPDSNKFELIKDIAEAIVMKSMFYNEWYIWFDHFRNSIDNDNFYDIPTNLISNSGLSVKPGGQIYCSSFINSLPQLERSINDELKKNDIRQLISFYKDKKGFEKRKELLRNDLFMVYYLRNMIVHNSYYPSGIIHIYARKALFYAESIICTLQNWCAESSKCLSDILVEISNRYDRFESNFEDELLKLKGNTVN